MKIDPYTKTVLTVIAVCLLVIAFGKQLPSVIASGVTNCSAKVDRNTYGGYEIKAKCSY